MSKDSKWTYEGFLAAAAKALWEIHQAKRLQSRTSEVLSGFGIEVPEGATDGTAPTFVFPGAVEPEDTYIGSGTKLSDLSPEARARREAKRVTNLRQMVYSHMREMTSYSRDYYGCARGENCPNHGGRGYKVEEVVRHFDALGFPKPTETTSVDAIIRTGDTDKYIVAQVPGRLSEDDAKAKLLPLASHSTTHLDTVAAFGEGTHSEDLILSLRVYTRTEWPDIEQVK